MKIPVSNTTAMPIYVGAAMIPPGETRHFEEQDVPPHLRPTPPGLPLSGEEQPGPDDYLAELLKSNVADVVATLPDMELADVERLGELEQAGAARKGVLNAIAEELLVRADADADTAGA